MPSYGGFWPLEAARLVVYSAAGNDCVINWSISRESSLSTERVRSVLRWLHVAWAIIGTSICILLATLKSGHPPGLVIVPIAAAIWVVGHILLWLSHKLAIRGEYLTDNRKIAKGKWPVTLTILVILCGILFIFGILGLASFFI